MVEEDGVSFTDRPMPGLDALNSKPYTRESEASPDSGRHVAGEHLGRRFRVLVVDLDNSGYCGCIGLRVHGKPCVE